MINATFKEQAITWLNSKERDFTDGIKLLENSGFKPGVVRRLKSIGDNDVSRLHLVENIRQFITFTGENIPDTDADLGVIDGKQPVALQQQDDVAGKSIEQLATEIEKGALDTVKPNAAAAIIKYAQLYRMREIAHRKLRDIPETNEQEHVASRKKIIDSIASATDKMEKLYPLVEGWLQTQSEPTDEELNAACSEQEETQDGDSESSDYDLLTSGELKEKIKSVKTKILRRNNLLLYQQETKAKTENPLPESPKRTKYETEIKKLEAELEAMQYALARKA